jgi:hypothetical protein
VKQSERPEKRGRKSGERPPLHIRKIVLVLLIVLVLDLRRKIGENEND